MNKKLARVLYVTKEALRRDPSLQPGRRGARKLVVTDLFKTEFKAIECVWEYPTATGSCPVQVMPDTEIAVFTHLAKQDRHLHNKGTEIYMVMEGKMVIEADDVNYPLASGDMIIINPGVIHEVKIEGTEFMCRVVTVHCGGEKDKFLES